MNVKDQLSVLEKLLIAAYNLENEGLQPFSAEDLVVSAWRKFPDTFGLAGYQDEDGRLSYPDSNRIFAEIMGSKPIRKRGLLVKVGKKMYQLTEAGHEHARLLLGRLSVTQIEKGGISREVQQELRRLLTTKAVEKYRNDRLTELSFHDACAFWRISPRSSSIEFNGRTSNFLEILNVARQTFKEKEVTFEHGGQIYTTDDLDMLLEVHNKMLKKFSQEIDIITRRTDERN